MTDHRFATLWPIAHAHGWHLDNTNLDGYSFYATPPNNHVGPPISPPWNYLKYQDKLVFVPPWFEETIEKLIPPPDHTPNETANETANERNNAPVAAPVEDQRVSTKKPKLGWGKWAKSFIWKTP
jgi:hypothetical protein